jgi:hypothetical protein
MHQTIKPDMPGLWPANAAQASLSIVMKMGYHGINGSTE